MHILVGIFAAALLQDLSYTSKTALVSRGHRRLAAIAIGGACGTMGGMFAVDWLERRLAPSGPISERLGDELLFDENTTRSLSPRGARESRAKCCENGCSITIVPLARGLATSPRRRARLRFRQPNSACETKEVRPRLTTAVP